MSVNVGKTALLFVNRKRIVPRLLRLGGQEVSWMSPVLYLGCSIDHALWMTSQVDRMVNKTRAARALLRPVLASELPLRTNLGIYKTYSRSRFTFAAPYAITSPTQQKRLQSQQNIALLVIISGTGRYVRNEVIARDLRIESVGGVWSLRNLSISVPRAVLSGEGQSAVLKCTYDLEGAALYSIRWYRAQIEFYRYVPRELPPTMVFPLPGASVDLAASDHQQVRIVNLNRRLSGEYQCEVTADAPLFHTDIRAAPLTVVDPPFRSPRLSVSQRSYTRGDTLRANCSVDEAYPAPNITWILDEHKIAETVSWWTFEMDFKERGSFSQLELSVLEEQYKVGLTYTSSSLSRTYPDHYIYRDEETEPQDVVRYTMVSPQSGHFSLGCVATIYDIYARKSEPVYIREDAPHPASVTGDNSSGATTVYDLLLIIFCASAGPLFSSL